MVSRSRSFDVLVVALGIGVSLVLGEILLRTFWPQRSASTIGMFRTDPFAGFALQPNFEKEVRTPEYRFHVLTDADGYRVPRDEEEDAAASRALVIGDSFAFGIGVDAEDAFPEKLEDLLAQNGERYAVRNGAVGGYGALRSSRLLLNRQAAWKPDMVIHAFYVGNDFEDSDPQTVLTRPQVKNGRMVTPGRHPLLQLRLGLRSHSHLYFFLREHLYDLYRTSGLASRAQHLERIGLADWPAQIYDVGWPAAQAALREIHDWSRTNGVRSLVVLVPAKYQVDDAAWSEYRKVWDLPESAFERDRAQRVVTAFLNELDVPVLDLLPILRSDPAVAAGSYYPVDRHWTELAHQQAADALFKMLVSLGWVRSST